MFKLHVVQAKFGDSMIFEFGNQEYILLDGGPATVYRTHLAKALSTIVKTGELQAVIVSHIDRDHIKGVLDFFTDMKKEMDQGRDLPYKIGELWHNSFSETIDLDGAVENRLQSVLDLSSIQSISFGHAGIVPDSVKEGNKVRQFATALNIPINNKTLRNFFSLENTAGRLTYANVSIIVLGPTEENLKNLREHWDEWLTNTINAISEQAWNVAALSDESVPNLSSITFLLNVDGKKLLFTGDARADHILEGLKKRKLLKYGKIHLDLLKVPHHGSDRNVDRNFFSVVTADTYVISADGTHDNPDYATLAWIVEEAKRRNGKIKIVLTNDTTSSKRIRKDYDPAAYGYAMVFIEEGENYLTLEIS